MSMISFILDGQRLEVEAGKTILEAAQQYGIKIPTLCHDPRLKPTAACRLCLIEIEKARTPMPACNTLVTKDVVVKTTSEAILESRKMALELLLSDHYGDCISPCQIACPAGIDIQGQLAFIANGQYLEALKLIKESNPLPLVCGRVCPRFCEEKCRRNLIDGPVAINMTKRFVADMDLYADGPFTAEVKPASGYRVAVVGGGPAGLTAAYYLALEGHSVGLFESSPALGGMLRYGIPEYRLPKAVLDKEIASITRLCRDIKTSYVLGKDFTVEGLKKLGYQAVFLALGAQNDQKMQIPGEDLSGVFSGIGFLRDVIDGKKIELGSKVVVVGGGNTAIDAARTVLRLGAQEVTLVYRRSRQEMPANAEEVEGAEEEGVKFQFLTNPIKLNGDGNRVISISSVKMALGAPDASGRRRPEPVAGSEFQILVSAVIMAIGQSVDTDCLDQNSSICLSKRGGISVTEETMETGVAGVFAGGDCATGPATAVEAIGAGRRAAKYINQYLLTGKVIPEIKQYNCSKGEWDKVNKDEYVKIQRVERTVMPALKPAVRKNTFAEIDTGISLEDARKEAGRCLSCGCQDVFECKLRELSTEYKVNDKNFRGKRIYKIIKEDEHPAIARDRNKCILCGRCVRICAEVEGASALGFARRGIGTTVEPGLELPLAESTCDSCSQCISTCPTGAIVNKSALPKPGPFKMKSTASVCPYCGIGCSVELNTAGGQLVYVSAGKSEVNTGNLCHRGAFEIDKLQPAERVLKPIIKTKNVLKENGWQAAIATAAASLLKVKNEHGANSIAVLVSGMATNEEGYLAQKLAKVALGTDNIGYLAGSFAVLKSSCSFDAILKSDLILSYNCDLQVAYPIVALKIRQAVDQGKKLVVLATKSGKLDSLAALKVKLDNKDKTGSLKLLLASLLQQNRSAGANLAAKYPVESGKVNVAVEAKLRKLAQEMGSAARITLIVDSDGLSEEEAFVISDFQSILKVGKPESGGLIVMRSPGNAQGLLNVGVTVPIRDGIEKGQIKGVLIVAKRASDILPAKLLRKLAFSVLISPEKIEKGANPNVFLPGTTYAESEGTYTNAEGRVQAVNPAVKSAIGRSNINILVELSGALGYPMHYKNAQDVAGEINGMNG